MQTITTDQGNKLQVYSIPSGCHCASDERGLRGMTVKNPPRIESDTDDVCETSYRIYHKVDKQTQDLADTIGGASLFRKLKTCYGNKDRRVVLLEWLQMKGYIKEIESDATIHKGDGQCFRCKNKGVVNISSSYSFCDKCISDFGKEVNSSKIDTMPVLTITLDGNKLQNRVRTTFVAHTEEGRDKTIRNDGKENFQFNYKTNGLYIKVEGDTTADIASEYLKCLTGISPLIIYRDSKYVKLGYEDGKWYITTTNNKFDIDGISKV